MAEIINLRRARKARARTQAKSEADASRLAHGRTKAEKTAQQDAQARARKLLDGALRAIEARGQRQDYRGHAPLSQSRNVGVTHQNRLTFPFGSRSLRACREGVSRTPPFSTSVLDKLDLRSNPTGEMKGTPLPALTVTPAPEPGSRSFFSQRSGLAPYPV